ncbi:50S ribosomal protein L17 [bacterium]|nr:MAG: 50S ribosomal protein L17 [bacterium]
MRKRKKGRKFARKKDQRHALRKTLAGSLVEKQRIKTTLAKAKELRPFVEKLVTHARKQDVAAMRYLLRYLPKKSAKKLLNNIAPKFKDRAGGYTRIIKIGTRKSDSAKLALIEFVLENKEESAKSPKQHGK